jgi:hypothetical protein
MPATRGLSSSTSAAALYATQEAHLVLLPCQPPGICCMPAHQQPGGSAAAPQSALSPAARSSSSSSSTVSTVTCSKQEQQQQQWQQHCSQCRSHSVSFPAVLSSVIICYWLLLLLCTAWLGSCHHVITASAMIRCSCCSSAFWPAGWEPIAGGLRVDLLYGCPLPFAKKVCD